MQRAFTATGPDQLWVADTTYIRSFCGWICAAFVTDVFSRRIVGWQLFRSRAAQQLGSNRPSNSDHL